MDITDAPRPSESELDIVEEKPVEDDAEARRARRVAILAKYQAGQAANQSTATGIGSLALHSVVDKAISRAESLATPPPSTPFTMDTGAAPSPTAETQEDGQFVLSKDASGPSLPLEDALDPGAQADGGVEGVAAADYDPSPDMREDSRRAAVLANNAAIADGGESSYEEGDADEDIDDMFAIDDEAEKKPKKKKRVTKVSHSL
jgi:serine/threonine-protein kinase PRP4